MLRHVTQRGTRALLRRLKTGVAAESAYRSTSTASTEPDAEDRLSNILFGDTAAPESYAAPLADWSEPRTQSGGVLDAWSDAQRATQAAAEVRRDHDELDVVPGSLGQHKVVIEGLPRGVDEIMLLEALKFDVGVVKDLHLSSEELTTKIEEAKNSESSDSHNIVRPIEVQLFTDRVRGRLRRNAFVYFADHESLSSVVSRCIKFGVYVSGQRCSMYPMSTKTTLFIGNLPPYINNDDSLLNQLHRSVDDCPECFVELPLDENKNKGFAFLKFSSHAEALFCFEALVKNPQSFGTRPGFPKIAVSWAANQKNAATSSKHLVSQHKKLQEENAALRLENAELKLRVGQLVHELEEASPRPESVSP